ncbi:MAG TPA: hypothetical protein VFR47_05775 [Anaerolineales bacterium]|nr:hypothetical protein [Anaerolineales bacterium]
MHWARPHVNPMLALRNIHCSNRWAEAWQQISITLRQQERAHCKELHQKHRQIRAERFLAQVEENALPTILAPAPTPSSPKKTSPAPQPPHTPAPRTSIPAHNHPWRRLPIGRAQFWPADHFTKN